METLTKFEVYGQEMIEKTVKKCGNSGRIYLPPDWIEKKVKIIRVDWGLGGAMTDVIVRPMKEKDIGQAADIHRKVVMRSPDQDINYAIEDLFISFIKKSPKTCIIVEKDNKVVGFIVGCIKEWSFGVERSGWIEMIEVDPKFMGKSKRSIYNPKMG